MSKGCKLVLTKKQHKRMLKHYKRNFKTSFIRKILRLKQKNPWEQMEYNPWCKSNEVDYIFNNFKEDK